MGLLCLGAIAAGLVLACCLAQWTYRVNRAGLDKHPEALAAEARQMIQKLGYSATPRDWAFGFADEGLDSMHFYYRQSPSAMVVFDFYTGYNQLSYGSVTDLNPHWGVRGEVGVRLNPRGQLPLLSCGATVLPRPRPHPA